jgi:hypothetical protein
MQDSDKSGPGEVVWIYDYDIVYTMDDVVKALKEIGVNVKVSIVREFPPERFDFKFEKVE